MTKKEAYECICKKYGLRPVVMDCRDLGSVYGFFLAPPGSKKNERNIVGRFMFCVDKETGEVTEEEDWNPIPEKALRFADRLPVSFYFKE